MRDKGKKDCATTILRPSQAAALHHCPHPRTRPTVRFPRANCRRPPIQPRTFPFATTLCRQVPPPSPHFAPPTQPLIYPQRNNYPRPNAAFPIPKFPRTTASPIFSPSHRLPCRPVRPPLALQALPTILSAPARPLAPTQPAAKPIRYRSLGSICSVPTTEGLSPSFFVGFPSRQRAERAVFCGLLLYLSVPKLGRALIRIF